MWKWQRYNYLPLQPLGEDGKIVTGSAEHIALSRRAAAEGMVLLKNEGGLLPLARGSRVALFGKGSADYAKGGFGSGDVTVRYVRNLCDAMEEKREKVTSCAALHAFYRDYVAAPSEEGAICDEPQLPPELLETARREADVAIISICRYSGEGADRKGEPDDGDFYLSPAEQRMVRDVCDSFEKVVVVLNVGGVVDTQWFFSDPSIQAVLLAWQGGMEGAMAEADILCGDVCPSGKLADTFARSFDDYPSSPGFHESEDYVCYTEDIFVGYRYFETLPNAAARVNYPFGFGLSYTEFSLTCEKTELRGDAIVVSVCVRNIGKVAGKEVVQLYTSTERENRPAYELKAFEKTRLLAPNEAQTVMLRVPIDTLACYEEAQAAWVLHAGTYRIFVGNCVRSLRQVMTYDCPQSVTVQQVKNRCVPKKLPRRLRADGTYEPLPTGEYPEKDEHAAWGENDPGHMEHILPNMQGIRPNGTRPSLRDVADGTLSLDEFLNSLTDDELITLVGGTPNRTASPTQGLGGLDYLWIPAVMTADGPAGLRFPKNRGVCTTAWPIASLLACSWDTELVCSVGKAAAREVRENNCGVWLSPALNIHRSPLCGRNFEYFSEDPLLSGKLAAAEVRGIQSEHIGACVKHFCVNNKETNRTASDSRVSERALREIYLRGFEIAVRESAPWVLMTSYNQLNGCYTSENAELLSGILREEWGYDGLIVSDWGNLADPYREALAGNNVKMPWGSPKRLQAALRNGKLTVQTLRSNVRHLLEFFLRLD